MKKSFWLMKSEPEAFSISDLEKQEVALWDGVRNYQARNFMREMKVGDRVLFYHSSTKEIGCVGVMEVVKEAEPDLTQFDVKSKYYDSKSQKQNPRWSVVTVRHVKTFSKNVTLQEIKNDQVLSQMIVAKQGSRLSVTPVTAKEFKQICSLGR